MICADRKSAHYSFLNSLDYMKKITQAKKIKNFYILLFLFLCNFCFSQEISITSSNPNKPVFKVFPIEENIKQPSAVFKIFMIQDSIESQTPLLGSYSYVKDTIFFEPQFELGEGLTFNVNFRIITIS